MNTSVELFHAICLTNFDTSICPVCYHIKNPHLTQNSVCMKCSTRDSLWCCIMCGHVGCGHDVRSHAVQHNEETEHRYVMDLKEFKVWDYKTKKFFHQLSATDLTLDSFQTYAQANGGNSCSCAMCQHNRSPKLLKQTTCMECKVCQALNLWICLCCRHIGCCKHNNKHALQHYTKTQHPYVMQLDNFSIWDYKENKYQHRQLHDTLSKKPDTNKCNSQHVIEDFAKHLDRLERQWQEFSKLTETNQKMITIEKRLMSLTDEKKILEEKLHEHDIKLNELLTQMAKTSGSSSPTNHFILEEIEIEDSVVLRNIKPDPDCVITPKNSISTNRCAKDATMSFNKTKLIFLFSLGLIVHCFLRLCLQRITNIFTDLF